MDFLKGYVSDNTINTLMNKYTIATLYNFSCNKENVIRVIYFFRKIGINNIDEIMLYNLSVFMDRVEYLEKVNNSELVDYIGI